jgi:multisubunit Na+/H+ antiporter MnhB subunit
MRRAITIVAIGLVAELIQAAFWVTTAFMHDAVSIDTDAWMFFVAGFGLVLLPVGFAACYVRQCDVAFTAAILTAISTGVVMLLFWRDPRTARDADALMTTVLLLVMGLAPSAMLATTTTLVRTHRPAASSGVHA